MSLLEPIAVPKNPALAPADPHAWIGLVLDHFARGEQALGRLSVALGLSIANGSLGSLKQMRERLVAAEDRRARALDQRIGRWQTNRPYRHLLAHCTVTVLFDAQRSPIVVTRHLPRDSDDVTPDRLWSLAERVELLRQAAADSRSICDHVRNLLADPAAMKALRPA